jgi:tRNA pseudouridine32 synthase/23S rRNA pseudouridine746 synthase
MDEFLEKVKQLDPSFADLPVLVFERALLWGALRYRAWPDALVVHRLDQATSGLMLLASRIEMQRALSLAFEKRRMHKRYEAIVASVPEAAAGEVDMPMRLD